MYYIENGRFSGWSYFGSVLFVPLALRLLAKPLKVSAKMLLDMTGPVLALFLAIVKCGCFISGCCFGFPIGYTEHGTVIRFPSAIMESLCGLIICVVLLLMQRNPKNRGCLCPAFLVIYGACRFVLNFFRADLGTFRLLKWTGLTIPPGHLWSVVCIIWGVIWLYRFRSRACGRKLTFKEFAKTCFGLQPLNVTEEFHHGGEHNVQQN